MITNSCKIKTNTLSKEKIALILKEWDDFFTPRVTSTVKDLDEYANKIYKNAEILEAYDDKDNLIGLLCIYLNQEFGFITHFIVKPEYQKQGIGFNLLKAAENLATEKKINTIRLECFKINSKGLNFYTKHLFKKIKEYDEKILFEKILKIK